MTELLYARPDGSASGRALVLSEWGTDPALVERAVPQPPTGCTLVRLDAAAVAHLDLAVVSGGFARTAVLPLVPGTEGAGEVVSSARHAAGSPVRVRGGGVGIGRDGAWADHVVAPDDAVLPVPPGTDPALACSAFSPAASAHAALHDVAHVRPGETVLVTGAAGAVGALAVQLAARAGARVVAVVSGEAKRTKVPGQADEVLVGEELEPRQRVDVLVDTVGGAALPRALAAVVPGGRAVLVGSTAGRSLDVDLQAFLQADVALLPLNLLRRGPGLVDVFAGLLADLSRGELVLPVERYALDDAPAALARLRSGQALGKVALVLRHPDPRTGAP